MTVAQLVARLAGGLHQVTGEELEFAVARALDAGGFEDIETVRNLPGITRAVARTLRAAWSLITEGWKPMADTLRGSVHDSPVRHAARAREERELQNGPEDFAESASSASPSADSLTYKTKFTTLRAAVQEHAEPRA